MNIDGLANFWPLIHSTIHEIWGITEPQIENTAIEKNIPFELYLYSELGLNEFSVEEFQKRDPFSNPDQFKNRFAQLSVKGWILTQHGGHYGISRQGSDALREMIQAGDVQLSDFDGVSADDLIKLAGLLQRLTMANLEAPEPPQKWAIIRRFRSTHDGSPLLPRIRDLLLDLYAYRDDAHLSAARPYFGDAGIVWSVFSSVCNGQAVTAEQIAERMSFRGYEVSDYKAALKAAVQAGWLDEFGSSGEYQSSMRGRDMHNEVEKLTNEYFYRPWSKLTSEECKALFSLLSQLRDKLIHYSKTKTSPDHF